MLFTDNDGDQCEHHKNHTQGDCDPEKSFFNAAAGGENTTSVVAGQTAKTNTLVL
jgi:hypothetical protein